MQSFEFHPYASIFPLLDGTPYEELLADIKANGVREPVITYRGTLLDGRNRYRVCQALGIDAPTREYEGDAPLLYVLSLNLHRRHLDESQRAMIAARIATMSEGRPAASGPKDAVSQSKAAEVMNVGRASITRARKVIEKAAPEIVAAVEGGKVSVGAAAVAADASIEEQRTAAKQGPAAVRALAKTRRKPKASPPPSSSSEHSKASTSSSRLDERTTMTSLARAEPKRRALYLWREFVALKVTPAEFVRVAGRAEAASLTRSVARFFLEVGRLSAAGKPTRKPARKSARARKAAKRAVRAVKAKPGAARALLKRVSGSRQKPHARDRRASSARLGA